jgi:mRNA interferase MazF
MAVTWTPDVGEIVWLDFSPQAGHEQAGHRPALVLSPQNYNARRGMMICVPMTTKIKGYPFEVMIAGAIPSVALADQVRNVDWRARGATRKERATTTELAQVRIIVASLIGIAQR